jgi:hypothetical protein
MFNESDNSNDGLHGRSSGAVRGLIILAVGWLIVYVAVGAAAVAANFRVSPTTLANVTTVLGAGLLLLLMAIGLVVLIGAARRLGGRRAEWLATLALWLICFLVFWRGLSRSSYFGRDLHLAPVPLAIIAMIMFGGILTGTMAGWRLAKGVAARRRRWALVFSGWCLTGICAAGISALTAFLALMQSTYLRQPRDPVTARTSWLVWSLVAAGICLPGLVVYLIERSAGGDETPPAGSLSAEPPPTESPSSGPPDPPTRGSIFVPAPRPVPVLSGHADLPDDTGDRVT